MKHRREFLIGLAAVALGAGCEHERKLNEARREKGEWARNRKARLKELEASGMTREEALREFGKEDSFRRVRKWQDDASGVSDSLTGDELENRILGPDG